MKLGTESRSKIRYQIRISATGGFLTMSGLQSTDQVYNAEAIDIVKIPQVCCWETIEDEMFK